MMMHGLANPKNDAASKKSTEFEHNLYIELYKNP
jgi:hypothetical protein